MTTATLPAGLELTDLGDSGHLVDRRIGFSLRIPGGPRLLPPAPPAGVREPVYEALIHLADLPVSLRYRQGDLPAAGNATRAIEHFVGVYAANRSGEGGPTRGQPAAEAQRRQWGVEAAASTIYPLPGGGHDGDDLEEALVLYREGRVVTLTKSFSRARTSWVSWAIFNSALAAGLRWDPAVVASAAAPAPLWPRSSFLLPGVKGILSARRRPAAQRITALAGHAPERGHPLAERLAHLLQGSEAPTQAIGAAERAAYARYVGDAAGDTPLRALLVELLAQVETAHDLRGFAILGLHGLGKRPAPFAAGDEDPPTPFPYVAE